MGSDRLRNDGRKVTAMPGISSVGSAILSSASSLVQRTVAKGAASSGGSVTTPQLTPDQIYNLRQSVRDGLQQAFQQGTSIDDAQQRLQSSISAALQKNGVSDSDRQSVLNKISELFQNGGTPNELQQQASQLLTSFINKLQGGPSPGLAAATSGVGQVLDVTA